MITEYHRPHTIEEALQLIERRKPLTVPMGGGSWLNQPSEQQLAVVDLQNLGLDNLRRRGNFLDAGATATLQALLDFTDLPQALRKAIRHEATHNLCQVATLAGTLVAASGRSPFCAACLALDASLVHLGGKGRELVSSLGDMLPLRGELLRGRLITKITLPLNARLAYEYVARTPADLSIISVAVARWPGGRTRVVIGGFGPAPRLVLDGPEAEGAELAVREATAQAEDEWASATYRQEAAARLVQRSLQAVA